MSVELTDAVVAFVLATVKDSKGRSASVQLTADGIELHRRRPRQGKKATVSYDKLFDLSLKDNPKFFDNDHLTKKTATEK